MNCPAHTLQDLRKQAGLSQAEVAGLFGFNSYNTIGRMESGKGAIDPQSMRLLLLWQRQGLDALLAVQP